MKKLFILLATVVAFSSCNKGGSADNSVSCWLCKIEGKYNGVIIDVDTSVCGKNQQGINDFMAPYNTNGTIAVCDRQPL